MSMQSKLDGGVSSTLTAGRLRLVALVALVFVLHGLSIRPGSGYFPISKVLWPPLSLGCIGLMTFTAIWLSENAEGFWKRLRGQLLVVAFYMIVTIGLLLRFGHTWKEFESWLNGVPLPWLVQTGLFALTVATYEEIIIRKWLLNGLLRVLWPSLAVLLATLVFYMVHQPLSPAILLSSLAATIIAYQYQSVLATIVLHAALDWVWFAKMCCNKEPVPVIETLTLLVHVQRDIAFLTICFAAWGLLVVWWGAKRLNKIAKGLRSSPQDEAGPRAEGCHVVCGHEFSGETSPDQL